MWTVVTSPGAGALGHADTGAGYLARAGFSAQLRHRFVNHADAGRTEGVAHGQQAAISVGGDVAGQGGAALHRGLPGFAERNEM